MIPAALAAAERARRGARTGRSFYACSECGDVTIQHECWVGMNDDRPADSCETRPYCPTCEGECSSDLYHLYTSGLGVAARYRWDSEKGVGEYIEGAGHEVRLHPAEALEPGYFDSPESLLRQFVEDRADWDPSIVSAEEVLDGLEALARKVLGIK